MKKNKRDIKNMHIQVPTETWVFLKRLSIDQRRGMNQIIISLLDKYKNKLTVRNPNV